MLSLITSVDILRGLSVVDLLPRLSDGEFEMKRVLCLGE